MKKIFAILLTAVMVCSLSACGNTLEDLPVAETEDESLRSLRQAISDNGSQMGVAFLGVMEDDGDVLTWLTDSGAAEIFPFLADVTAQQVVEQPGNEVYCVVPASKEDRVTVRTYDALSDTDTAGDALYESADGSPVCLRGNVSDIMPNLEVVVSGDNGDTIYQPFLSLRDGSVSTQASKGSVYDFTPGAAHNTALVSDLYGEDFDYRDSVGNSGHFTYRVPQLMADTEGAAEINHAISEKYSSIVEETLWSVSEGVSLSCQYIVWESYEYEGILSLVVSCGWDADVNDYGVYLYDIESGRQLTTSDLLSALSVSEAAFLDDVRSAAATCFDSQYGDVTDPSFESVIAERRAWTLSDANINVRISAYVDDSGMLYAVLPSRTVAGIPRRHGYVWRRSEFGPAAHS